ncbi:hypothetical protein ABK040_002044 [Willaertia magna]
MSYVPLAYIAFSSIYFPISLLMVFKPSWIASLLCSHTFHSMDTDLYSLIIFDLLRLIGVFFFFLSCYTFFMITVHDKRSRTAFHLSMALLSFLLMIVIVYYFMILGRNRFNFLSNVCLLSFTFIKFFVFFSFWMSQRKKDGSINSGVAKFDSGSSVKMAAGNVKQPVHVTQPQTPTFSEVRTPPPMVTGYTLTPNEFNYSSYNTSNATEGLRRRNMI